MLLGEEQGMITRKTAIAQRRPRFLLSPREWILFVLQVGFVASVQASNDILRGNLAPPNSIEAMHNAKAVAGFETAHGFFVEPALQEFFEQTHNLFGFMLTWPDVVQFVNSVYGFCHILVTLSVALWVYIYHRPRFRLLRNVMLLTNALALVGYELYPMAPPRLTTGLIFNHRPFRFQDTLFGVIGNGKVGGSGIGYNPLSAMPSLHIAWALIVAITLIVLVRQPLIRLLAACYPCLMLLTVVITGNHYVMDGVGAAVAVIVACVLVFIYERNRAHVIQFVRRMPLPGGSHAPRSGLSG